MDITGKIIAVLPERSGTSARTGNEWKSQEFVLETHDQYPRKMVFRVFGADRLQRFDIKPNDEKTVSFDIDAHEWNGRWFNNIDAWNVVPADPTQVVAGAPVPAAAPAPAAAAAPAASAAQEPFPPMQPTADAPAAPAGGGSSDDLPF